MSKKVKTQEVSSSAGVLSTGGKAVRCILSTILILATFFTIFVIGVTVIDSLKTQTDLVTNFIGLPKKISFDSYAAVFNNDFVRYFMNSVILTVFGTVGCILLSSMAAYGIARYEFKGKKFLSSYFMIGMMVPVQVSILPLFLILRKIGLLNNLL